MNLFAVFRGETKKAIDKNCGIRVLVSFAFDLTVSSIVYCFFLL